MMGLNVLGITGGAHQQPQVSTLLDQRSGDMAAHKSRRACDEGQHLAIGT